MSNMRVHTPSDYYWPTAGPEELAEFLGGRIGEYYEHIRGSELMDTWARSYNLYYGRDPEWGTVGSERVSYGGDQGELALFRVNHYRSIIEHLLVLITGERPTYLPRALNSDYKSQAQAELAEGLVDYFLTERGLEDLAAEVCENALLFGEGWLYLGWDEHEGKPISADLDRGRIIKSGDIRARVLQPTDVIRDVRSDFKDQLWHVVHTRRMKWDLAERYPEFREDILNSPRSDHWSGRANYLGTEDEISEEISVYEFFHKRCDVLPEGLHCVMVNGVIIGDPEKGLISGLPKGDYPLIPMVPSEKKSSPFGYSRCWDLMALQEGVDSIASDLMTIHSAFAVPNVWTPRGANLTVKDLAGQMGHIETNSQEDKPELIHLLDLKEDSFKLYNMYVEEMQTLVGLNNIVRGKAEKNTRTAGQAALMSAEATKFNSSLERSWAQLLKKLSTHLIRTLKAYATEPMVVEITGKQSKPLLKEFVGADIKDVHKVTVELGDPLLRTVSGRVAMAEQLVALANTKKASGTLDYSTLIDVFKTGKLDTIMDYPAGQRRLVDLENEWLLEGKPPKALVSDDHTMHIQEHLSLLNEPSIRYDQQLTSVILNHIQEHINLYMAADPNVLIATGQQPPQVPPPVAGAVAGGPMPEGAMGPPPPEQEALVPGTNPGADNMPAPSDAAQAAGVPVPTPPPLPQM